MTDPLISTGNMFTCKGSQNHMISDMWKDNVRREQRAARRWNKKYYSEMATREQQQQQTAGVTEQQPSAILPPLFTVVHRTASSEFGSCTTRPCSKQVLDRDLSLRFPNCGHKPILASTFYRTNGVFPSIF